MRVGELPWSFPYAGRYADDESTDYESHLATRYPRAGMQIMGDVKQARDKAQYVRQQKGHSLTKHLLLGWMVLYIPTIYYAVSPNHYFHA